MEAGSSFLSFYLLHHDFHLFQAHAAVGKYFPNYRTHVLEGVAVIILKNYVRIIIVCVVFRPDSF